MIRFAALLGFERKGDDLARLRTSIVFFISSNAIDSISH